MISIRTNSDSINAQQNLNVNHTFQSKTIQQLTSGYRINSSADDAAGLAIANSYRSKVAELNQGVSNANDGVSQLQIIDGGLGNISTILDRMKTLATQSASATFTGNRAVLNQEYSGLLGEINRQATNINLNAGGSFNNALSVYIGGANNATDATIAIDLSGTSNAVDATSLGLSTSSVNGGGTGIAGNTLDLTGPGAKFVKGSSSASDQVFTFNLADPTTGKAQTIQATVAATADGSSLSDVLTSLNKQLSTYGITAGTDANGALSFGGTTAFTVSDNATVAPPPGGAIAVTSAGTNLLTNQSTAAGNGVAENVSNYLVDGKSTYVPPPAGGSETLNFTSSTGAKISVNLTNAVSGATAGDTLAHAINSINAATSSYGIHAVANASGAGISFQSNDTFSVTSSKIAGSTAAAAPVAGAVAEFTGNQTSLTSAPNTLINGSQAFTFNVTDATGNASAVSVTLSGGANGLTASQVVTTLNAAIAAQKASNPELGTITAALDSNNKLVFTGGSSKTAFTVSSAAAVVNAGSPAGATTIGAVTAGLGADNTTNFTADLAYTPPTASRSIVLSDGTAGGPITLTVAAGSSVQAAVKSINSQLAGLATPSTTKAVVGSDGVSISFQNASKTLTVGGTAATAAVVPVVFDSNSGNLNTGAFLKSSGASASTQTFTFHTINAYGAAVSTDIQVVGVNSSGTALTGAQVLSQINTKLAAAGITGINAADDGTANHYLTFDNTSTSPFTVTVAAATNTPGTAIFATPAKATNTNLVNKDVAYGSALNDLTVAVNDGNATKLTIAAGQNTSVSAAIAAFNTQLIAANSSVRAVLASDGTNISFQNANNFVVGGTASNTSTSVAGGFGTGNTSALQAGPFLAGGAQTFTFNVAKADGTSSSVNVTLAGGANGLKAGDVLSSLNAAIAFQAATNSELGTITAALDSNNKLVFTGGANNTAFTVSTKGAIATTAGAIPVGIAGAGNAENTGDHVVDSAYGLSSGPQTISIKDGTGTTGTLNLTVSGNSNIASAVKQINTQLQNAGSTTKAVVSADGTAISFQNATNTLSVGGTDAAAVSGPRFTSVGTAADLSQSGAYLKGGATQVFHFHIADANTGASKTVDITLNGGTGGITGAAAIGQLNTQLQQAGLTSGQGDLANIVAGLDGNSKLTFTNASGSHPAYSLTIDAPSANTGLFGAATASATENANNNVFDVTFSVNAAITTTIHDATSGNDVTLNLAANSADTASVGAAVSKINAQLIAGNSTIRAVVNADGTKISYQGQSTSSTIGPGNNLASTAAPTFTNASQDLSKTGDYLQGASQTFTFNVLGANGTNDSVSLQLNGGTGLTGAAIVTGLQSLINSATAAHPGLANIVVGQDSTTNALTFTAVNGSTSPFTVKVSAPSSGSTGVYGAAAATVENTNLHVADYTPATSGLPINLVLNDGTATTISVTAAANTSLSAAVAAINQQLQAAGSSITALISPVASGSPTQISFQSANNFRVGGAASNPTTTKPASISANSVQIQSGPFLANNATQAFSFNVVDPNSKSSQTYSINISGGANGLTSSAAVITALNTALASAVAGTPAANGAPAIPPAPGLAGIQASVDATTGAITFSGNPGQAFTVSAGLASGGTGLTSNSTAVSSDNSALYSIDQTFTAPTAATALRFTSGTTTADVTISAGATIDQQITQTNVQLAAAGINNISAVKSGDGLSISYQSSAAFSIGTPADSGVFNGSTPGGTTTNAAVVPNPSATGLGNASAAINSINAAIKALGLVQGTIGSGENKLQYAINLAQSQISNFSAAESQIRDTDVAAQAANLTKSQVLTQTSIAAMAQANAEPQSVLKLLQ